MMKKEVKHLGISASVVLMVMVVFGTLFTSCYTKDDIPVVPDVKPVPNMYLIQGSVISSVNGVVETLKGVNITCDKEGVVTVGEANFIITVKTFGEYTVSLTKDGYTPISYKVVVPQATQESGQVISVSVTLSMYKDSAPSVAEGNITPQGGELDGNGTSLIFPEGALTAETHITMSVNKDIISAPETQAKAAAQFALGEFLPSGLQFAKPIKWNVYNPMKSYYLGNVGLQFKNGALWEDQTQGVAYSNGNYVVELTHFSTYRMIYKAKNVLNADETRDLAAIDMILNEGATDMTVNKIACKSFQGCSLDGLDAGLSGLKNDKDRIRNLIIEAIQAKAQCDGVFEGMVEADAEISLEEPIVLPTNWFIAPKGSQVINNYTFTFTVKEITSGTEVTLTANVTVPGAVTLSGLTPDYYGAHHHTHGGHITDGGAGGGMVIGD